MQVFPTLFKILSINDTQLMLLDAILRYGLWYVRTFSEYDETSECLALALFFEAVGNENCKANQER